MTAIKFEKEILKISRRGSRSLGNVEFSHFTLFLQRTANLQRTCTAIAVLINIVPVCRRGFLNYFVRRKYQRRKDQ